MKTIATLIVFSLLTLTNSGIASEIKWAEGTFFKVPHMTTLNAQLTYSTHPDLKMACDDYQVFIDALKKGKATIDPLYAIRVNSKRKLILRSHKENSVYFKAFFKLEGIKSFRKEMFTDLGDIDSENDKLPFFNMNRSFTGTNDLRALDYTIKVVNANTLDSFVNVSSALKLEPSTADIVQKGNELFVEVNGRDLACDLLSQNVVVTNTSKGTVRITPEASEELSQIYNYSFLNFIKKIFTNNTDSVGKKSARLGYQLGKVIENLPVRYSESQIEIQIGNLIDIFLTKDLNPTDRVVKFNKTFLINTGSELEVNDLTINLGVFE